MPPRQAGLLSRPKNNKGFEAWNSSTRSYEQTESLFPYYIVYCLCVSVSTIAGQFALGKKKDKFGPFHTIKAQRGSGGITPLIPNLGARWRRMVNITNDRFTPRAGLDDFERWKIPEHVGTRTPDRWSGSLVAIPTTLSRIDLARNTLSTATSS
jgi:hypothetical protein